MRAARLLALSGTLLWGVAVAPAFGAPSAKLWDRWTAHDSASVVSVDHSPWAVFLETHLRGDQDGINRIAYSAVADDDKAALDRYVATLEAIAVSGLNRDEQLVYWINLYNALTVKVVLDHYPVDSIRDIKSGFFSSGPWGRKLARVEGEALTLDDIEHRILRPIWRDPRIHYAVNCAALGCPNLQADAFTTGNVDAMLNAAARDFVNHARGVSFEGDELVVSSIYEWFKEDFGNTDAAVIAHLKRYASDALAARLAQAKRIDDDRYDWRLNDAS